MYRRSIFTTAAYALLAGVSASAQTPARTVTVPEKKIASSSGAIARRAASLLEERYLVRATGARYAEALRTRVARGDYAGYTEPSALAERITADLQAISTDRHLCVRVAQGSTPLPVRQEPAPATRVEASAIPGIRAMRWLKPGVAYLSFEHFDDRPEALAALRGFFADHASARALIIDSRANRGGAFDMLATLSNTLFGEQLHLADKDMSESVVAEHGAPFPIDGTALRRVHGAQGIARFQHWSVPASSDRWHTMPVFYLTSRATFSAAEHMAMVLKTSGRALLIGEPTGGGNHFGGTEAIGGGLEMFVPVGRTSDSKTGADWEGTGVTPDVPVPAARALEEALRRVPAA